MSGPGSALGTAPLLLWVHPGESKRKGLFQKSGSLGTLWDLRQAPPLLPLSSWESVDVGPPGCLSACCLSPAEGPPLSNTTFPHVLPLITLLECDSAPAEGPEPWGSTEHGVEVVLAHLEAARTVAHHGGLYHTNAEVKLQGECGGCRAPSTARHSSWPSIHSQCLSLCPAPAPLLLLSSPAALIRSTSSRSWRHQVAGCTLAVVLSLAEPQCSCL